MAIKPYIDEENLAPVSGTTPTREELYRRLREKYMNQRQEAEQTMEQPYTSPTDLADSKRISALASGLSRAAAKMGTIEGRTPSSDLAPTLEAMDRATEIEMMGDMSAREKAQKDLLASEQGLTGLQEQQILAQREFETMDVPIDENLRLTVNNQLTQRGSKLQLPRGITNRQIQANPLLNKLVSTATSQATTPRDRIQIKEVLGADLDPNILGKKDPNRYYSVAFNLDNPSQSSIVGATRLGDVGFASDKAAAVARGKEQVKEEEAIREAEASADRLSRFAEDVTEMYKGATLKGPITGRVAELMADFGVSPGVKESELIAKLQEKINAYIKDISGAAVSDQESKRLAKVLPTIKDSEELFTSRLQNLVNTAQAIIRERQAKARQEPTTPDGVKINLSAQDITPPRPNKPAPEEKKETKIRVWTPPKKG